MSSRNVIEVRESLGAVDRRVYTLSIPKRDKMIAILTTDEVTVLGVPRGQVKDRGQICTAIAEFFLNATDDIMPNFLIATDDDGQLPPNVMLGEYCEPIPVKFIARRYLTGSLYEEYTNNDGVTSWGKLEDGLPRYHQFKELMLTPMLRITTGEYEPITEDEIISMGVMKPADLWYAREKCVELYTRGEFFASKAGLTLADTKFEFGWNVHGGMVLIDELLTPDCSRYWQSQEAAFSDENPPKAETSSEHLSAWVRQQAAKHDMPTDDVVVPSRVRREAYFTYAEIYRQLLETTFSPIKPPRDVVRALKTYVANNFE
ncbi:MAG: phosphoribosylaminoimidazolesuccinocarboxamide synthase [Candidatus Saccharimonadales bacterium]